MSEQNEVTKKLEKWYSMNQKLSKLRKDEMELRKELFGEIFPNAVEGTNKHDLGGGYTLKANHKIDRKIDEAALPAIMEQLGEGSMEKLTKTKISLTISAYRELSDKDRNTMDQALIIKPGSPSMEIVAPKEK